jgi:Bacterial regulatory helix-turn-helix protein, lysR family
MDQCYAPPDLLTRRDNRISLVQDWRQSKEYLIDEPLFVQVLRTGSFAEAARRLGPRANTARWRAQKLERKLVVRLMQRSTLRLMLRVTGRIARDIHRLLIEFGDATHHHVVNHCRISTCAIEQRAQNLSGQVHRTPAGQTAIPTATAVRATATIKLRSY